MECLLRNKYERAVKITRIEFLLQELHNSYTRVSEDMYSDYNVSVLCFVVMKVLRATKNLLSPPNLSLFFRLQCNYFVKPYVAVMIMYH